LSEVLRDLVVSLSLDSNNFSRNLTSISRQVAEAESAFKRAAAGVDGFEKTVAGTQAQISSLQQKLVAQRNAFTQYERALEAANTKLAASVRKNGELGVSLDAAKTRFAELKARIDQTKAAFQTSVTATGDNSEESNRLGLELLDLEEQYKAVGAEVKKLDGQLAAGTKSLQNNADAVTKARTGLNLAQAAVKQTEAQIRSANTRLATLESAWTKAGDSLTAFSKKAAAVSKSLNSIGISMTRYATVPILALGAASIKASVSFESAFASVRKTVDATEEEYQALSDSAKQMSTEVATSADTIAEVMANAGQLGIRNNYLVSFSRTMIDIGNSTDLAAGEAATAIAQFANVTKMAQTHFSNFGSALVDLGNNFATTESAIMNMATRLAAAGTEIGLSQAQILGFATALSSVGLEAEAGGTAFSKAMIQMQVAVETGNDSLSDFAKVSGMTRDAFSALWKTDPSAAIQAFIVGLSQMDEQGVSSIVTLEEMGFSEVRLRDTLMRATNATELFSQAQETATSAWGENTALSNEAAKRYATTESKLKNLKNTAILFGQQLGDDLNPTIQSLADCAGDLLEKFQALDESQRMQIIRFAGLVAAVGPASLVLGRVSKGVGALTGTVGKLMTAVGKAGGGWAGLMSVVGSSPAVWLALGAATVVATVALVDYATGAKAAREALKAMNEQAEEWRNTQAKTIYDTGNDALARFGLSEDDFTGAVDASKDWMSRLVATWTDGKGETNAIVKSYVDEFTAGSDEIRNAIQARQKIQEDLGADDPQNDEYLKQLDAYDKEVERLLKKRQNGFLTEEEQARLGEIVQLRAQIKLTYVTGEGGAYDSIRGGVEAEKARLEAEAGGQNPVIGVDLYTDALKAGAEGYQAQVDALNASYDEQYAAVKAISDADQRDAALKELNARHMESLNAAQAEYNSLVAEYGKEAFQSDGIQKAKDDMQEFVDVIDKYNRGELNETGLKAFTDTLDEGQLASYIALLGQLQESGLGDMDLGGGLTAEELLGGYSSVTKFLEAHAGDGFDALGELLGASESEAMRVLVDLGLTEEGQTLADTIQGWESNGIQATVSISGYVQETGDPLTVRGININPVTGVVEGYDQKTGTVYTIGKISIDPVTGVVTGYNQETGDSVVITGVNIDPVTGTVTGYDQATGDAISITGVNINPETGEIAGYNQKTGDAITIGNVNIDPVTGDVTAFSQASGEAMEIQGVNLQGVTGVITGYIEGPDATKPTVEFIGTVTGFKLAESGYDTAETLGGMPEQSVIHNAAWNRGAAKTASESETKSLNAELQTTLETLEAIEAAGGDALPGLSEYIAEALAALDSGTLSDEKKREVTNNLTQIMTFLQAANEFLGAGNNLSAGIAEGMTEYGWQADAETVVSDIEDALRTAADSHSPANATKPAGGDLAAGLGVGMSETDFSVYAAKTAGAIEAALRVALSPETMRGIGRNASYGLGYGILSGEAFVVAAIRTVARASVTAAKQELKISSPSAVFRDEVGRMGSRGIGVGFELEARAQARTIQNASRYLVGAAQASVSGSNSYDNRRTYNYNAASVIQVDKLYVRDEQDIYALAVEIASLTKRRQRGRGLRMA
jgi:TP901 family phage tail tape measure protein